MPALQAVPTEQWLTEVLDLPKLPQELKALERAMHRLVKPSSAVLAEPVKHVMAVGGKRLRPALVMAVAASQNHLIDQQVLKAGAAIELIHISSLVHDDIIDEAETRRGQPTISHQQGTPLALLVGDYLLSVASAEAAACSAEIAILVNRAFAVMTEGQALELADGFNANRTIDTYLATIAKKTAILLGAACAIGATAAGAPQPVVKAFTKYGEAFGMAFQLIDDVLDLVATQAERGKPVGHDLREGTYTLPILLGLRGPAQSTIQQWLAEPDKLKRTTASKTLLADGSLTQTMETIEAYNQQAERALGKLGHSPVLDGLRRLPAAYTARALHGTVLTT